MMMTTIRHTRGRFESQYRGNVALSNEMIAHYAPSVLQTDKHESRSDRYTHIPTIAVVDALRKEGFEPFEVMQSRTRIEGKREFAKHMIKFRHTADIGVGVKEDINEILVLNGHDGSAAFNLMPGQFRTICSNGLIAFTEASVPIRVLHRGNVIDNVIEGTFRVVDDLKMIAERREGMKEIALSKPEQNLFAEQALALRWDDPERPAPITVEDVLRPVRYEDRKDDLWTTFNRVQEHLVRGGQSYRDANLRRQRTRAVTGIDQNVRLNRSLWRLAEEMARLKSVA